MMTLVRAAADFLGLSVLKLALIAGALAVVMATLLAVRLHYIGVGEQREKDRVEAANRRAINAAGTASRTRGDCIADERMFWNTATGQCERRM